MSAATKWLIGILVVFNVLMAGLMSILFGHHFDYKNRFKDTEAELKQTQDQLENVRNRLEAKVQSKQQQIESLSNRIDEQLQTINEQQNTISSKEDEIADREEQIEEIKEERDKARTRRDELDKKVQNLRETLANVRDRRDEWKERANLSNEKLQETIADLRSTRVSMKEVQQRYVDAKNNLHDAEQTLDKYVQKYGPIGPVAGAPAVDGYVKAANPDTNVYLINVGRQDGVRKGHKFTVVRGGKYVAELKVFEAHKDWATTRSVPDLQKRTPKVGDQVTTYSPAPETDTTVPEADNGDTGKDASMNKNNTSDNQ